MLVSLTCLFYGVHIHSHLQFVSDCNIVKQSLGDVQQLKVRFHCNT